MSSNLYPHEELKSFWRAGYKIPTIKQQHPKYRGLPNEEVSRIMKIMFEKEMEALGGNSK